MEEVKDKRDGDLRVEEHAVEVGAGKGKPGPVGLVMERWW